MGTATLRFYAELNDFLPGDTKSAICPGRSSRAPRGIYADGGLGRWSASFGRPDDPRL